MENIFSILYKYKPQPNMTPEESYFTGRLKNVLSLDNKLCNKFVKFISDDKKFNAPFVINSQVRYKNSIIDLEIIDKKQKKIFIEVKLKARENRYFSEDEKDDFGQVEKYLKLNNGYVCFISQGSDDIDIKEKYKPKYLGQFEWFQIYELLNEYYKKSNNLKEINLYFINNFLKLMKELEMQPFQNFTKEEIKNSQGTVFEFYFKLCDFLVYVQNDKQLLKFFKENKFSLYISSSFNKWQIKEVRLKKNGWGNCSIGFGLFYANSDTNEVYKTNEGIYYYTYAWISKEDAQKIKKEYKKFNLNKKYFQIEFNEEETREIAINTLPFSEFMKNGEKKAIEYIYKSLLELKKKGVIKAMDWAMKN